METTDQETESSENDTEQTETTDQETELLDHSGRTWPDPRVFIKRKDIFEYWIDKAFFQGHEYTSPHPKVKSHDALDPKIFSVRTFWIFIEIF
jgi:hypothetical protein